LLATDEVPAEQIAKAMHFPTMILSARVRAAGFYEAAQRGLPARRDSRCACLR
jgi:hypothetical protein